MAEKILLQVKINCLVDLWRSIKYLHCKWWHYPTAWDTGSILVAVLWGKMLWKHMSVNNPIRTSATEYKLLILEHSHNLFSTCAHISNTKNNILEIFLCSIKILKKKKSRPTMYCLKNMCKHREQKLCSQGVRGNKQTCFGVLKELAPSKESLLKNNWFRKPFPVASNAFDPVLYLADIFKSTEITLSLGSLISSNLSTEIVCFLAKIDKLVLLGNLFTHEHSGWNELPVLF